MVLIYTHWVKAGLLVKDGNSSGAPVDAIAPVLPEHVPLMPCHDALELSALLFASSIHGSGLSDSASSHHCDLILPGSTSEFGQYFKAICWQRLRQFFYKCKQPQNWLTSEYFVFSFCQWGPWDRNKGSTLRALLTAERVPFNANTLVNDATQQWCSSIAVEAAHVSLSSCSGHPYGHLVMWYLKHLYKILEKQCNLLYTILWGTKDITCE